MASTMMNVLQRKSQLVNRPALGGRRTAFTQVRPQRQVQMHGVLPDDLKVKEFYPEWPNEMFVAHVLTQFPEEQAIANVEEARCLYENGWVYLDVRPALEADEVGRVKNAVNIPIQNAKYQYDPETRTRTVVKTDNPDFMKLIQKRFPKTDVKLIVACSDGRTYCIDALEALDEAGYENIVALKGGYNAWFNKFDNKLNRRRYGEYSEQYGADGDSCGIHASGAGFERSDFVERYTPKKF